MSNPLIRDCGEHVSAVWNGYSQLNGVVFRKNILNRRGELVVELMKNYVRSGTFPSKAVMLAMFDLADEVVGIIEKKGWLQETHSFEEVVKVATQKEEKEGAA